MNNNEMQEGIKALGALYNITKNLPYENNYLKIANIGKDTIEKLICPCDINQTRDNGKDKEENIENLRGELVTTIKGKLDDAKTFLIELANDCILTERKVDRNNYCLHKTNSSIEKEIKDYIWARLIGKEIVVGNIVCVGENDESKFPSFLISVDVDKDKAPTIIKENFRNALLSLEKTINNKEKTNSIIQQSMKMEVKEGGKPKEPRIEIKLEDYADSNKGYYDLVQEYTNAVVKLKALYKYLITEGDENKEKIWKKVNELFYLMDIAERNCLILGQTVLQISDLIFDDCKQIVLTGAPGTGKTYSATEYVKWQMMARHHGDIKDFDKDWEEMHNNQFANKWSMVQFHPSFDYTDFVEGIRPAKVKSTEGDTSSFVRMDGVFKKFCRDVVELENGQAAIRAIRKIKDDKKNVSVLESNIEDVKKLLGKLKEVSVSEGDIENAKKLLEIISEMCESLNDIEGIKSKLNEIEVLVLAGGEDAVLNTVDGLDEYLKKIEEQLESLKKNGDSLTEESKKFNNILSDTLYAFENKPNYYFIIDEINRADLSKVFGELMYCLEESYRGPKYKIQTQYSNLDTYKMEDGYAVPIDRENDVFKDGFYIPENVIIIGTMNDIDRSVDTFDFALRRRFRWVKVDVDKRLLISTFRSMAKDQNIDDDIINGYAEKIDKMNKVMNGEDYRRIFRTPEDYFVGPAYFSGLFKGQSMDRIWNDKVEPLLREYVRGRDEGIDFLKTAENQLLSEDKKEKGGEKIILRSEFADNEVVNNFFSFLKNKPEEVPDLYTDAKKAFTEDYKTANNNMLNVVNDIITNVNDVKDVKELVAKLVEGNAFQKGRSDWSSRSNDSKTDFFMKNYNKWDEKQNEEAATTK